jgi:7-keto-8-aminopelargonate synthetase-like enzyme
VFQRLPRHGPPPQGDRGDDRRTVEECGTGAGGTRNISGNAWHHKRLEAELADLHHKEDALLFTSGYVSNWAALSTLGSRLPNAVILSDELNHASMIEGIRHARCQKVIWKHNDPEDLDRKLAALPANATKIVAFESVYSMDGDIAPSRRSSTSATSTARCPISTRSTRSACTARAAAVSRNVRG